MGGVLRMTPLAVLMVAVVLSAAGPGPRSRPLSPSVNSRQEQNEVGVELPLLTPAPAPAPADVEPLDVNLTISEVERQLASDPSLPRLSRAQIILLLDEVTHSRDPNVRREVQSLSVQQRSAVKDLLAARGKAASEASSERARALMVVLPYKVGGDGGAVSEARLQELYTRPPVTRLLVDNPGEAISPAPTTPRRRSSTPTGTTPFATTATASATERITTETSSPSALWGAKLVTPSLAGATAITSASLAASKLGASNLTDGSPVRIKVRRPIRKPIKKPLGVAPTAPVASLAPVTLGVTAATAAPTTLVSHPTSSTPSTRPPPSSSPRPEHPSRVPAPTAAPGAPLIFNARPFSSSTPSIPAASALPFSTAAPHPSLSSHNGPHSHHRPRRPPAIAVGSVEPIHAPGPAPRPTRFSAAIPAFAVPRPFAVPAAAPVAIPTVPLRFSAAVPSAPPFAPLPPLPLSPLSPVHPVPAAATTRVSTTTRSPTTTTTRPKLPLEESLTQDLSPLMVSFEMGDRIPSGDPERDTEDSSSVLYMTPPSSPSPAQLRYNSQYSVNRLTTRRPQEAGKEAAPAPGDGLQAVLAALTRPTGPGNSAVHAPALPPVLPPTLPTVLPQRAPGASGEREEAAGGAAAAAQSLSDDMQRLLASFGLLPGAPTPPPLADAHAQPPPPSALASQPHVDPDSYTSFKPLPPLGVGSAGAGAPNEMHDFLATFGLMPSGRGMDSPAAAALAASARAPKAIGGPTHAPVAPPINTEMLTDESKRILENLGLIVPAPDGGRKGEEGKTRRKGGAKDKAKEKEEKETKEHVFNPSQHLAELQPTEDEVRRLNKLLDSIKKFNKENGSLTQEDLEALAASNGANSASNAGSEQKMTKARGRRPVTLESASPSGAPGPSPFDAEELLQLFNITKNEVKRQQPSNSSATANATIDGDGSPSFADLAESFGGGETAAVGAGAGAGAGTGASGSGGGTGSTPNGLYFLVDWNSFLEVGEPESAKRVNIRIAPRVGDPRLFLPVGVP